jgi:dTDP-4-amino-4,6-dideoxygalactose transaminase
MFSRPLFLHETPAARRCRVVTMEILMQVPLLDIRRQNAPLEADLRAAFARVLASANFILGAEVEAFEEAAAAFAGARFAVGLSSGTDALLVALMALGIGPGDEVICPSFTFVATAGSIARVGARPVFADSCPNCFNLDPASVERSLSARTKAIIPVHLFGQPADMDPIADLARVRGIFIIEDVAQAFGAEYRGRKVGTIGDCGTVSFYPTKNLGAFGDAGLLLTNSADLAAAVKRLRNHGAERQYYHPSIGGNFRLDAIQAALLAVKLPLLPGYTAARQLHAREYERLLRGVPGLVLPSTHSDRSHIYNQYTLRVPGRRDAFRAFLAERGIGSAIYYPVPLHRQECFAGDRHHSLPVADALASECVSIPVFPELSPEEQEAAAAATAEFCRA